MQRPFSNSQTKNIYMKLTFKLITGLALLGTMASPASAGIIAKFLDNDVGNQPSGFFIEEPPVWARNPTVTVSNYTKHGSVTGGANRQMGYEGWGTTINPNNYVGFTITPNSGDTLVLDSASIVGGPSFSFPSGSAYNVGYRIDTGSGFGAWTFAPGFTLANGGVETWTFAAPVTTTGTVEFGLFAAFPNPTSTVGTPEFVVNGTAGDTTPDPALVGVISQYRKAATYPLDVREPSTITYNWDTNTLFCLGDENDEIVEIDKRGIRISRMRTNQLKFSPSSYKGDPEALTYLGFNSATGRGRFMIGAERENVSMILEYYRNGDDTPDWMRVPPTIVWGPTNGNVGLEGISYDSRDGSYYGIKEKQPTSLIRATNVGTPQQSLTNIDLNDVKWRHGMRDISDLFVMANSAAYADSEHIILLARAQKKLIEITKDGTVVDSLDIANFNQTTIEGIVMDDDGVLYLCGEGGGAPSGSFRSGNFHVLTKPKVAVAGTGGRQIITGTSGNDEVKGNQAADTLVGGDGADTFVFKSLRDGVDTINGFTPGVDVIDLSAVLQSVGYVGSRFRYLPLTDGAVRVVDSPSGAVVQVRSGTSYRSLIVLPGHTAAQAAAPANFLFITTDIGN